MNFPVVPYWAPNLWIGAEQAKLETYKVIELLGVSYIARDAPWQCCTQIHVNGIWEDLK